MNDFLQNNQFATGALLGVLSNFILQKVLPAIRSWIKELENFIVTTITINNNNFKADIIHVEDFLFPHIKKRNYILSGYETQLGYGKYFIWKKSLILIYKSKVTQQQQHYDELYIKAWFYKDLLKDIKNFIEEKNKEKISINIIKNGIWFSRLIEDRKLLTKNQKKLYNELKIFFEEEKGKKISYLLSSSPGQGKSAAVLSIAHLLKRDIKSISITKNMTLDQLNECVLMCKDSIILLEDIDRLPISKEDDNDSYSINKGDLMNVFDGIVEINNCALIATTNNYDSLDPALIRKGRFDNHIYFDNPDEEDLQNIVKEYNLDNSFVKENLGKTLAEIMFEVKQIKDINV